VTSSTLFAMPQAMTTPRPAGFILGYASLTVAQIQQGIETLGAMLFTVSSSRT
jgi:GntR family transcriptional regulator/MocR family aminotransferase